MNTVQSNVEETYDFEAEVPQVMSIIINSVYSSKELFLRELISNASDALSKMMTQKGGLDSAGYSTEPICSYKIQIILDKHNKTITIKDNGIGMTKAELKAYLGSIASSGTKKFREAMDKSNGESPNVEALIGQFGLGFYSAFLVADRVDVITKSPKDEAYLWSSDGTNKYTIRPFTCEDLHGTSVILKLKEGEDAYLNPGKITELVKKHSLYIKYPLSLVSEEEEKAEEPKEKNAEIEGEDVEEIKEGEEAKAEETENPDNKKAKIVEKVLNTEVPVWTKNVKDVPEEDLKKLYKSLSNDYEDYAAVQSWHYEGVMDLKIILFFPKKARFDFFEQNKTKSNNIKIFNSNVFVTDELSLEVVPEWMHFVVGAVSSPDFPMNISREFLQGKAAINLLKNKLPKCIAEMIQMLAKDESKFNTFYSEFSTSLKLAVRQTTGTQQEAFAKFLRYPTNQSSKLLSFDDYLAAAPENTKQILILTGLSLKDVTNSIYLDSFKDRTVLLMSEAVDEIMLQGLKTYKEFTFQRISAEGVENSVSAEDTEKFTELKNLVAELYKDSLEKVELTNRAVDVPALILTTRFANSGAMESIINSHISKGGGADKNPMLMMMMNSKKIFEINVNNPIVQLIQESINPADKEGSKKYIDFLYNSAMISCGFNIDDKRTYVKNLYEIFGDAISKKAAEAN